MNKIAQLIFDELTPIFSATDQVLEEWASSSKEGNLQFPSLLGMMAVKLNWDTKQVKEYDPFIRHYVRRNDKWHVTRGAHGGIMLATEKQKKDSAKAAKDAVKAQMQAAINAKLSTPATSTASATTVADSLDSDVDSNDDN